MINYVKICDFFAHLLRPIRPNCTVSQTPARKPPKLDERPMRFREHGLLVRSRWPGEADQGPNFGPKRDMEIDFLWNTSIFPQTVYCWGSQFSLK